jgi:hypothetical protein
MAEMTKVALPAAVINPIIVSVPPSSKMYNEKYVLQILVGIPHSVDVRVSTR